MKRKSPLEGLSPQELRALKIFFWFSLALVLLMLWTAPSLNIVGLALGVLGLGLPLFGEDRGDREPLSAEKRMQPPHSTSLSPKHGLFLALCAIGTPLLFGARSVNVLFFMLFWFGLLMGGVALAVLKAMKDSKPPGPRDNE